jgi:uncharacterized protein (DUF2235 family)
MARKLVVCCDGTWNTPRDHTNITRTYQFLRERLGGPEEQKQSREGVTTCAGRARDGSEVVLFYDRGVGTNWFQRLSGGALGVGLSENVRDAYHFLAHEFTPGTEVYVFGFSRGAYTARSLCGFIKAAGLLKQPDEGEVWRAYLDYYVTESRTLAQPGGWSLRAVGDWVRKKFGDWVGANLRDFPRHEGFKIRFIGVYDTVGALGVPLPEAAKVNERIVGFHDTTLSDLVEHAVQALAVDEQRGPYAPTLWTLEPGQLLGPGQTVLQVWFPGVHSDIGGGYREKGIGDITLDFMMRQAASRGLTLDPDPAVPDLHLEDLPAQHDSLDKAWQVLADDLKVIPRAERPVGTTVQDARGRTLQVAGDARLHVSLVRRLGRRVAVIADEAAGSRLEMEYGPANVSETSLPVFE